MRALLIFWRWPLTASAASASLVRFVTVRHICWLESVSGRMSTRDGSTYEELIVVPFEAGQAFRRVDEGSLTAL